MDQENETLRWPTNLDHAAIVERLVRTRALAEAAGLVEITRLLAGVENLPAGQIGAGVVAALTWIQDRPEHTEITSQLAMVAMNLKNL